MYYIPLLRIKYLLLVGQIESDRKGDCKRYGVFNKDEDNRY